MLGVGGLLVGAVFGGAGIANAEGATGFGGTVACGGNYLNRMGGTEAHFSVYVMRNRNASGDIKVDRIRFYKADGSLAYDSNLSGFPTATNFILSAGDQVLDPMQTAQYSLSDWLAGTLSKAERPGTTLIDWSSSSRVAPPAVVHVRLVRERDPISGSLRAERSRGLLPCSNLAIERGASRHAEGAH